MAPRIISWSDREVCISPVHRDSSSSTASIIFFDSKFSDPIPSHSPMSPTGSEALGHPSDKFGAQYSNLPGLSDEGRTPRGGHATLEDSFARHEAYFFKDGNVTFLVRGLPESLPLHTRCADPGTDRWNAILCPPILLFPRFHLFLYTICPARYS